MYSDKTLVCRECGAEFVFSSSEQAFYAEKGFQNEPGRCPGCRARQYLTPVFKDAKDIIAARRASK